MRSTSGRCLWMMAWSAAVLAIAGCMVGPSDRPTEADRALADEAVRLSQAAQGTAGEEQAHRMLDPNDPCADWLAILRGDRRAAAADLLAAREQIVKYAERIRQGMSWPEPIHVAIPRRRGKVMIDGRLDDDAWTHAWVSDASFLYNQTQPLPPGTTRWRLTWDDEYLFAAIHCRDANLMSKARRHDEEVFLDDCIELFVLPDPRARVYWEVQVSPSAVVYDSLQRKHADAFGFAGDLSAKAEGLLVAAVIQGTLDDPRDVDEGFSVELALPWRLLPGVSADDVRPGLTLRLLLARLDRNDAQTVVGQSFTPVLTWGHNIRCYATVELAEGEGMSSHGVDWDLTGAGTTPLMGCEPVAENQVPGR